MKNEVEQDEAYFTPMPMVLSFLDKAYPNGLQGMTVLEPCVGTGQIVQACLLRGADKVIGSDINSELVGYCRRRFSNLIESGKVEIHQGDCRCWSWVGAPSPSPDLGTLINPTLIITNPPFSLGQAIAEHFLQTMPCSKLALLLRLAFLESTGRVELHEKHPSNVHLLDRRIQFYVFRDGEQKPMLNEKGANGCDKWAYAWFQWDKEVPTGRWSILRVPTAKATRDALENLR